MATRTDTRVARIFNRLTDLPTMPAVVDKLLQLSERDASFKDFAKLISTDPGLTAKILKLVNSAFYSLKSPVSDLAHACTMIGSRTIKSIALSVSVMQLFKGRCDGFGRDEFWRHSLATALVGRKIGQSVKLRPDRLEEAYISGLLHACGVPLFVQFYPREYGDVLSRATQGDRTLLNLEEEEFGASHPEVGGRIASHWRLPPTISTVVRYHRASATEIPSDVESQTQQLIDVVRLADQWTRRLGLLYVSAEPPDVSRPLEIPAWMNRNQEQLDVAIGDVKAAVSQVEGLFN